MRYRRVSYRYAMLLTANQAHRRPLGDLLPLGDANVRFAQTYWRPPADICETDRAIEVIVDLAGVDQDELDVVLFEDALIVEGERRLAAAKPNGVYHVAEIRQGPFRLELALPMAIDQEHVNARYDQGLLHITFQKRDPQAKAKAR
jgi:HSP20 family protein